MTVQAQLLQDCMTCEPCQILELEKLYKDEFRAGRDLALMYHGGMCGKLAVAMIVQKAETERVASIFVERLTE